MPETSHSSTLNINTPAGHVAVTISEPIIVSSVDEDTPDHWVRIHPFVDQLPDGRLVMQINRDRDVVDAECIVRTSTDDGLTWQDNAQWPFPIRGSSPLMCIANLEGNNVIATCDMLFATDKPDHYILPTWRSTDSGQTWGDVEAAPVYLPGAMPMDMYDPPAWFHERHPNFVANGFVKPHPPEAHATLFAKFGRNRLLTHLRLFPLGNNRLLLFAYVQTKADQPYETLCTISEDAGRSWTYRSTPGPYDPRYATENFLDHGVDGLCEPAVTRRADGSLLVVMRLGSRHPLYAAESTDEGATWSPPRALPVQGILPSLATLPGNTLALCSGRPDVSFSLSFDGGYRWPFTWRFLEDGKSEDPSTRNNGMVQIAPGRLLFMYDYGGYHAETPPGFVGPRRIVGHIIDVQTP